MNEAGSTPGKLLDVGASRRNHYKVQVGKEMHGQDEIEEGYSEDPCFVATPDGTAVRFQVRMDAPTTPGSRYPRSELREVEADGSNMAFDPFAGTHRLGGRTRITHLPPNKREVVVASVYYARGDDPLPSAPVIAGELEANGSSSWYFKAGAYAQSNADTDDPEEYVAVELRDLRTEHAAPST